MPRPPSRVVMIGTSFGTKGGIASVLDGYRRAGLFQRWPVDYIATHRDGNVAEKFLKAVDAIVMYLAALCTYPRAVLHVHGASRASFWRKSGFMALALAARWPVVYHLHGGGFATFYEKECGRLGRAVVRFFLDRAACIVVVSERWAAWMRGVTRNPRVVTIENSVSLPPLSQSTREPALVAFTGRCSEAKGVYDLLQATLGLRRALPRMRLELAGDGDLDEVERAIASLGLADRVRVHGWIDRSRRDELLARASVFVLPSHAEGLPMSLLEAMAAGCAVVATRVGGIPDVVRDGENGLLVEPGDTRALQAALERLVADPALARRLGAAARATIAARYTPERAMERLEQIYAGLGVAKPGTVPAFAAAKLRDSPQ
ncbi:MAG TPA: glycosyltransferase family 4 protein [Usitatibacter sp.]|nr:glycosyltransferase family 4 protein [Usitatibacter sp.]